MFGPARLLLALEVLLAAGPGAGQGPDALRVRCLRVGSGEATGRLVALDGERLTLAADGEAAEHPLDAFREVVFEAPRARRPRRRLTVTLRGGGRLAGARVREGPGPGELEAVVCATPGEPLPDDARAELEEALRVPPVGSDRAMLVRDGEALVVPCVVQDIDASGARLMLGGERREVPWAQVAWLVFAEAGPPPAEPVRCVVELADGTAFPLAEPALEAGSLAGRRGAAAFEADASALARIRIASDRCRYLSDLRPSRIETTPFIEVTWEPRFGRAVSGGPISLGGATYPKGIGMHTRTAVTYELDGGWERFHAAIGIDDAAGDRGSAVFRVLVDGHPAFESPPLGGGDPPRPVEMGIAGARTLTLEADFGDPVEAAGNFADWAEARIVRPKAPGPAAPLN